MSIVMIHQRSLLSERLLTTRIIAMELLNLLVLHVHVTIEVCVIREFLVANLAGSIVAMCRRVVVRPVLLLGENFLANFAAKTFSDDFAELLKVFVLCAVT